VSRQDDLYALDRRATEATRARIAALTDADLDRPSTCSGWDVRAVLAHLVGGNIRFAQALRGEPADWPSRDAEPITAALAQFDATAATMAAAVAGIDDPSRPALLPGGAEPPAAFAVGVHGTDMLVHGWDIAIATGQDPQLDRDLCLLALGVVAKYPPSFWGSGRYFAPQLDTESADPQDRLLAITGRDKHARV
jgi:uncharacterized protein (TIGR03086 family)